MSKIKTKPSNSNSNANSATTTNDEHEPSKLDYAIAKHLRNKLPNKEAKFLGIKRVNYFIGSKAVDVLMESKWAPDMFKTRNDATLYLHCLLVKKFFHRARKIVKMDGEKKKFKLDMHNAQVFEDTAQPFVWLYEPTSITAWLLCLGVVFGVIAICLFPLWPPIIRTWVYYLCIAGLVLLSSILGLAVLRHIVFFFLWALTFGKLHFWLLPNLTEDVGFFESFWPLYTIETGEEVVNGGSSNSDIKASSSSDSHQD